MSNKLFYLAIVLLGLMVFLFIGIFISGRIYYRPVDQLYNNIDSNEYFNEFRVKYPNQHLQRVYSGFGVEYRVSQESNDFVLFQNAKTNQLRLICETHNASTEEAARRVPAETVISRESFKALIEGESPCEKDVYGIWTLEQ